MRFLAAWQVLETREGHRLPATALAKLVGVSDGLITQWMNPKTNVPPAERVLAVARVCGVDPGWLAFGHSSGAPMLSPEQAAPSGRRIQSHAPAKTPAEVFGAAGKRKKGGSKE